MTNQFKKVFAVFTFYCAVLFLSPNIALAVPPPPDLRVYDELEASGNYYWMDEEGRSFLQISIHLGLIDRAYRLIEHDALSHLDERFPISAVLLSAVGQNDISLVKKIIAIAKQNDVFNQLSMNAGLWTAVVFGKKDYVELFLSEGASFSALVTTTPDLIVLALSEGQTDMVKLLNENGFSLESVSLDGELLLNVAVYKNNKEIISYLLRQGADITLVDNEGLTALGWAFGLAEDNGNTDFEIIDMLVESGADPCDMALKTFHDLDGETTRVTLQQLLDISKNQAFLEKLKSYSCQF